MSPLHFLQNHAPVLRAMQLNENLFYSILHSEGITKTPQFGFS